MTDIDQIRRDVSLPAIAQQFGVDLAPNGNEFEACCPFHQERTPSFTIFPGKDGTWRYYCFGCSEKPGDVIDFVEKIQGVSTAEAIRILNGDRRAGANIQPAKIEARNPYAGITVLNPPTELAPDRNLVLYNPKRERTGNIKPSAVFPFRRDDGSVIGYVLRHDLPDGKKETPQVCWVKLPDGRKTWARFPFPKPRPLYGAERVAGASQVIVVEGEKKVDAIFRATGRIAVSAAGGVNGGRHADWSALKGKKVLIWPDADHEGFKYLAELAELLADIASEIKFVDVARVYYEADGVRDGGSSASGKGVVRADGRGPRVVRERGSGDSANGTGRGSAGVSGGRGAGPRRAIDPTKGSSLSHADWLAGKLVPRGWDVADAERDGWDKPAIDSFMKYCGVQEVPEYPVGEPDPPAPVERAPEPPVPDNPVEPLEALRRDWCFVGGRSVFRDVNTGAELKVGAFDLMFRRLIPMMDFLPNGTVLNKPKEVSASDWLTGYGFGETVQDTIYLPQEGTFMEIAGQRYLNAYLPGQVPRAAASYQGHWAIEVWRGHLQNILPDDWSLLLQWLAYNVQNPGKKVLWAPIIKGTQGDGKTSIGNMMGAVMGSNNAKVVGPESLHSDFNGYAEGSCVAFLEEIRVKGHNRHDAMNKLKPLITNSVIEVVRKGQDGRNVPNVTNYMAFTNFEDALVLDVNDRRWGVFFTRFQDREGMAAASIDADYWVRLHDAYKSHADVLRAWLLSVDVSGFDPNAAPPITAAKMAMIKSSVSGDAVMLAELIALGGEGVAPHAVATDCLGAAAKAAHQQPLATTRLAQAMIELGWRPLEKTMKWNGKARRVYIDGRYDWPDERLLNAAVRDMLDATLPGSVTGTTVLDDAMHADGAW